MNASTGWRCGTKKTIENKIGATSKSIKVRAIFERLQPSIATINRSKSMQSLQCMQPSTYTKSTVGYENNFSGLDAIIAKTCPSWGAKKLTRTKTGQLRSRSKSVHIFRLMAISDCHDKSIKINEVTPMFAGFSLHKKMQRNEATRIVSVVSAD